MSKIIVFSIPMSTQETPCSCPLCLQCYLVSAQFCSCCLICICSTPSMLSKSSSPRSPATFRPDLEELLQESFPCLPGSYYTMLIWSPRIVSLYIQLLNYSVKLIYLRKTVLAPSGQLIRDQSSKTPDRNKPQLICWLNVYTRTFIFIFSLFLKLCIMWDVKIHHNFLITIIKISDCPILYSGEKSILPHCPLNISVC